MFNISQYCHRRKGLGDRDEFLSHSEIMSYLTRIGFDLFRVFYYNNSNVNIVFAYYFLLN